MHTRAHTHTHTYIDIYIQMYITVYVQGVYKSLAGPDWDDAAKGAGMEVSHIYIYIYIYRYICNMYRCIYV